jgi:hypothetical protein
MDALGYEAPGQLAEFSPFARSPQGDAGAGGFAPTACKRLRRQTTPSRPLACAYPRKRGTETLPPVAPLAPSPRPDRVVDLRAQPLPRFSPFTDKLDAPFDSRPGGFDSAVPLPGCQAGAIYRRDMRPRQLFVGLAGAGKARPRHRQDALSPAVGANARL